MACEQQILGSVATQHVFDTEYTADSAEFCPCEDNTDLLLCGTYQLKERVPSSTYTPGEEEKSEVPNRRVGRLYLFSVENDREFACTELTRCETAGVLDIKWNSSLENKLPMFAVADSCGKVTVYSVIRDFGKSHLSEIQTASSASLGKEENSVLALSLDWSTVVNKSSPAKLISSDSGGGLSLMTFDSCGVRVLSQWKAHNFEVWISAFNYWDTNYIYSGGDDCLLKGWDMRSTEKPVFVSKRHEMGVVSVQSNPVKEHLLATGSYDEHLLVWDARQMRCPLSDTHLGGGIFRVKWHPVHAGRILTASMHNGFHVVDARHIPSDESSLPVIGHYIKEKHGSLAYGADWSRQTSTARETTKTQNTDLIATCSFYDHSLHIWDLVS